VITDVAALALVLVVAILAVLVWLRHRDVGQLHWSFDVLLEEMRADRAAQVSERAKDRVVWPEALTSMQGAVRACNRLADAVIALVRRQQPGPPE
jgi:hypothetical protein